MEIKKALRLGNAPRLALVGAGGKTAAIFQIASAYRGPVIVTTSTHFSVEQTRQGDNHFIIRTVEDLNKFQDRMPDGVNIFTGPIAGDRATSISFESLSWLDRWCSRHSVPMLIEADGSRQRPIKAPAQHEPAISPFADMVLVITGMQAVGKPLSSEWVHHPELFAVLSGLEPGDPITPKAIIKVLSHPDGGLKNIPAGAKRVVVLNQADTPELREISSTMAKSLLIDYHAVLTASLKPENLSQHLEENSIQDPSRQISGYVHATHEPVAGIVLAAGGAQRFGSLKQLLDWHGKPLVWHAAQQALDAGLRPVILVIGAQSNQITSALVGLPVNIIQNPDWEQGQGTSVKAGVGALPPETGAAVFLLADQPQIPVQLIERLVKVHAETMAPITAPWVEGRLANPVLFDKDLFLDLMGLTGDAGGRQLFSHHEVTKVRWDDSNILLDIDTPEDYRRILNIDLV